MDVRIDPIADRTSGGGGEHERIMAAIAQGCANSAVPTPDWPVTALAPFSSARKWSGAGLLTPDGEEHWVLGATDVLVSSKDPAAAEAERLSAQGLRVLLLARASSVDAEGAPGVVHPVCLVVLDQKVRSPKARALGWAPTLPGVVNSVARLLEEFRNEHATAEHR